MFTKNFWIASGERALKTFAQVLAAILGANGVNLIETDWVGTLSTVVTAVALSFLTSIASAKTGPEPSPALFGKEAIPAAQPTGDSTDVPADSNVVAPPGFIVDGAEWDDNVVR